MLLLTFQIGGEPYAIDVRRIVEVLPRVDLRAIPHAPAALAGLFDYRGSVVPVVDLGLLVAARPCRDRLSTRVVLVDASPDPAPPGEGPAPPPDPDDDGREDDGAGGGRREGRDRPGRGAGRRLLGLIAEQVSDVAAVEPEQVISAPLRLAQAPYLGAMVQLGGGMVQQLSVERVLDEGLARSLFGDGEGDLVPGRTAPGAAR